MTTAYPTDVPNEDIQALFDILTGRREKDLKLAAKSAWVAQGYLQSLLIGDPAQLAAQQMMHVNIHAQIDDAQGVALLGALLETENREPSDDPQAAGLRDLLGGALRKQLAGLILPLLQRWLTDFLQGGGLERIIGGFIGGIGGNTVELSAASQGGCCQS